MSQLLDSVLPDELKLLNKFNHIGTNNHSIRNYGIELLEFIKNHFEHFNLINTQ